MLQNPKTNRKPLILAVAVALLIFAALGSTVAYIITQTGSLKNIFTPYIEPTASMTVYKVVEHPFGDSYELPEDLEFSFQVDLGSEYAGKAVKVNQGGTETEYTADSDGKISLSVKPGVQGIVSISDITAGTQVTVTEDLTGKTGFSAKDGVNTKTVTIPENGVEEVVFTNVYTPDKLPAGKISVTGKKTLEGREWKNGDSVSFELKQLVESTGDGGQQSAAEWGTIGTQTITAVKNEPNEEFPSGFDTFDFSGEVQGVTFDHAGEYYFCLEETACTISGVTYNAEKIYFTVVIADADMDGVLEVKEITSTDSAVTVSDDGTGAFSVQIDFVNQYAPEGSAEIEIQITKTLNDLSGQNMLPEGFVFELYDTENMSSPAAVSSPTAADGNTSIKKIYTQDDIGTYSYVLVEKNQGRNGMDYDPVQHMLQVVVRDDSKGGVEAFVWEANSVSMIDDVGTVSGNTVSGNTVSGNTVSGNTVSGNTVSGNTVGGDTDSDNTVSGNTASGNATGDNTVSGNTMSGGNDSGNTSDGDNTDGDSASGEDGSGNIPDSGAEDGDTTSGEDGSGNTAAGGSGDGESSSENSSENAGQTGTQPGQNTQSGQETQSGQNSQSGQETQPGQNSQSEQETQPASTDTPNSEGTKPNDSTGQDVVSAGGRVRISDSSAYEVIAVNAGYTNPVQKTRTHGKNQKAETGQLITLSNEPGNSGDGTGTTPQTTDTPAPQVIIPDGTTNSCAVQFTNTYDPADVAEGSVVLNGDKDLNGRSMTAGEFSFDLFRTAEDFVVAEDTAAMANVLADADGGFSFDISSLDQGFDRTKVGTYYYVVQENQDEPLGGITYDPARYYIIIEVTDQGGALEADITVTNVSGTPAPLKFVNEYHAEQKPVIIRGTKQVSGGTLQDNMFTFELWEADASWQKKAGSAETVKNQGSSFSFEEKSFPEGDYYYVLTEKGTGLPEGWKYDATAYRIHIKVTDDGRGTLQPEMTVTKVSGSETENVSEIIFSNSYDPDGTSVELGGTKEMSNGVLAAGMFRFELYRATAEFVASGDAVDIAYNDENGSFAFNAISYQKEGTQAENYRRVEYYLIKEDTSWKSGSVSAEVVYDSTEYGVTVTVTDNGSGKLEKMVEYVRITSNPDGSRKQEKANSVKFINSYADDPQAVIKEITVKKTVKNTGTETIGPENFRFRLQNLTTGDSYIQTTESSGRAVFRLPFTQADVGRTYSYKLIEINDGRENVTYSTSSCEFTIAITENAAGNGLTAVLTSQEQQIENLVVEFVNTYHKGEKQPESSDTTDTPGQSGTGTSGSGTGTDSSGNTISGNAVSENTVSGNTVSENTAGGTTPKTGDDTNILGYLILLIASGAVLAVGLIYRKRRKH